MGLQSWSETLINSQVDGTALSASVAQTTILPPAALLTLPAQYYQIGRILRVTALGRISTLVTTPGTISFFFRHQAINVATSGAIALNTVAKVNVPFWLEWVMTCRSIGSGTTATLFPMARFSSEAVIGSPLPTVGGSGMLLLAASAPAVGNGFDSTIANSVDLQAQWSVNNAANSIQVHQYILEALN